MAITYTAAKKSKRKIHACIYICMQTGLHTWLMLRNSWGRGGWGRDDGILWSIAHGWCYANDDRIPAHMADARQLMEWARNATIPDAWNTDKRKGERQKVWPLKMRKGTNTLFLPLISLQHRKISGWKVSRAEVFLEAITRLYCGYSLM